MHVEKERKLQSPDGFSLARLPASIDRYTAESPAFARLHTVYYDTSDFRLARWGCSLRYRIGEGWTLKLPAGNNGDALSRQEHSFESPPDAIPARGKELARPFTRGASLHPVAELRTLRVRRAIRDDDGRLVAQLTQDDVHVVRDNATAKRAMQIEIELESDGGWRERDRIAIGDAAAEPEITVDTPPKRATLAELLRAALGSAVDRYVRNEVRLRLDDAPEPIHQARVAVRRFRSALKTFTAILDRQWADGLSQTLRIVSDRLGRVVRSNTRRYGLRGTVTALFERAGSGCTFGCTTTAAQGMETAAKARAQTGNMPSDRQLHRIRIAAKHIRYAMESCEPALDRRAARTARRAKDMQTLLGEQHDAVVATQRLREASTQPDAAFVAGQLTSDQKRADCEIRAVWRSQWHRLKRAQKMM